MVLRKIATIINADAHPLPYPYRNIKQKAVVHQDEYKLEVRFFVRRGVLRVRAQTHARVQIVVSCFELVFGQLVTNWVVVLVRWLLSLFF